jgi:hypothetical protein
MQVNVPPDFAKFEGFGVQLAGGDLHIKNFRSYESRNDSMIKLLSVAIARYRVQDFSWVVFATGDFSPFESPVARIIDDKGEGYACFTFSTRCENWAETIPDFVFNHWRETGLDDYEQCRSRLARIGAQPPTTDMLGWRGARTHQSRDKLVSLDDKLQFDCEYVDWDRSDPSKLTAINFLSLEHQVERWRYLLDIRGRGYSGRLKLFLASRRLVFVQDRPDKEFFFEGLRPWVHYVPVSSDLGDLQSSLDTIKSRPSLEREIVHNAAEFSEKYLSRDFATQLLASRLASLKTSGGSEWP